MEKYEYLFTSVRDPKWANAEKTAIICLVKFAHLKPEVQFVAANYDCEKHGRDIFNFCLSGQCGDIQEYEEYNQNNEATCSSKQELTHWPEAQEFLKLANEEIRRGTPRGIVLVWSSMIEDLLGKLIECFFIEHSMSREIIWKDSNSSLGTFSGRMKIAFALGLISRQDLNACNQIRVVRNFAAHQWNFQVKSE